MMLKRFSGKNPIRAKNDNTVLSLIEPLLSVKTIEDCEAAFEAAGLLGDGSLQTDGIRLISEQLRGLRAQGLGLEPNLIGRAVPRFLENVTKRGDVSLVLSKLDTDFVELRRQADTERDAGKFGSAQFYYWRALQLFPSHPAALVQYGHSLKEQGLHSDALIAYLDAFTFGALKSDVEAHALFVAEKVGLWDAANRLLNEYDPSKNGGRARPPSAEVIVLAQFFLGRSSSVKERAAWMCKFASKLELTHFLIGEVDFRNEHRRFLQLLSDTQLLAE